MTNSRTLKAKSPEDLLALVPYTFGFHPEDSIVLIKTGQDAGFLARVDLPYEELDVSHVVGELRRAARQNAVRRCALVLYTVDACLAERLTDDVRGGLAADGIEVVEAVRADGQRWFFLTGDQAVDPGEGRPYDLSTHPFTAQAVLDGRVTLGSRQQLADTLIGTDPDATEAVQAAADEAMARFTATTRHPLGPATPEKAREHLVQEGHWVGERVRRFLSDGAPLDAQDAGRMLVAMVAIEIRDVAWAEMTRANSGKHIHLWRDLVRRSPCDLRAAPAALLGFAAWLSGEGALAWCAVERCQEAEPDYSLASLLTDTLAAAIPPSRWEPIGRDALTLFAS